MSFLFFYTSCKINCFILQLYITFYCSMHFIVDYCTQGIFFLWLNIWNNLIGVILGQCCASIFSIPKIFHDIVELVYFHHRLYDIMWCKHTHIYLLKIDGDVCYRNKMNVFFYVWQNSDISIKLWVVERFIKI